VAGKPAGKFIGQAATGLKVAALREQRLHLANRIQHRRMFVDMTVARRKPGLPHPLILLPKVRLEMVSNLRKAHRELIVWRASQRLHLGDKFLVQPIHGRIAKQERIGPFKRGGRIHLKSSIRARSVRNARRSLRNSCSLSRYRTRLPMASPAAIGKSPTADSTRSVLVIRSYHMRAP